MTVEATEYGRNQARRRSTLAATLREHGSRPRERRVTSSTRSNPQRTRRNAPLRLSIDGLPRANASSIDEAKSSIGRTRTNQRVTMMIWKTRHKLLLGTAVLVAGVGLASAQGIGEGAGGGDHRGGAANTGSTQRGGHEMAPGMSGAGRNAGHGGTTGAATRT